MRVSRIGLSLVVFLALVGCGFAVYRFLPDQALVAYILVCDAAFLLIVLARMRACFPLVSSGLGRRGASSAGISSVEEFHSVLRQLHLAGLSDADVRSRLGPLVRQIAEARLAQHHGVDLREEPDRARELVGRGRVWQLVDASSDKPADRFAGGWSQRDLEQLLDELERI